MEKSKHQQRDDMRMHSPTYPSLMQFVLALWIAFLCWSNAVAESASTEKEEEEEERLEGHYSRGYTFPLNGTTPNTTGWRTNQFRRIAQVERMEDADGQFKAWLHIMAAAVVNPNFTQHGWGLTRAPPHVVDELRASLHTGLPTARVEEIDGVDWGGEPPLFVDQLELNGKILEELKPMHEAWAGVPLTPVLAYGLRAYRNNSILSMHVDRAETHIISSIVHVDSSEDAEPWPIFMEDFEGNTNEIILTSGDMLFYESSKCIHGRPRPFHGSWYSSLFVHYHPTDWDPEQAGLEVWHSVPPRWERTISEDPNLRKLKMRGPFMSEPECPHKWCGTLDTIKWSGPAKEGVVITTRYTQEEDHADEL